jgi:energy-coupling factor transporter ATP-binding protein EcfA2
MSNNRSDNPTVAPILIPEESLKTDRTHWYRGDKRPPERIFEEGFKARGDNTNLLEHVHGNAKGPIKDSAYISTSILEDAASRYPKDFMGRSYIYLLNPACSGVDVNKALVVEIDTGRMLREDVSCYLADHEMAIPYQIKKEHIKGAWIADSIALHRDLESIDNLYAREINKESFMSNPHYVQPLSKTVASIKYTGKGLTAVAIYFDTSRLWKAYQSGDDKYFFSETTRVIGGWSGAVALGTHWGKQGALNALRFTKHPGVVLASGVVGAVTGSILGYMGGDLIAQNLYGDSSVWTDLYQTLKRLEPNHDLTVDVQTIKPIENDLFEKIDAFWSSFKIELKQEGSLGAVIRKHLPATTPRKPEVMAFLKRLDYRGVSEAISAQRTSEEMFGVIQDNPLRVRHSSAELLSHANIDAPSSIFKDAHIESSDTFEDETLRQHAAALFKDAKVSHATKNSKSKKPIIHSNATYSDLSSSVKAERQAQLEKIYQETYELSDRAKGIRESLKTGDDSNLTNAHRYSDKLKDMSRTAESWSLTFNAFGDATTGKLISTVGVGLSQAALGASLLSLPNATVLQTIGGWSAWIAAASVFLSLAMADDADDEHDAIAELKMALVQLGMALRQVLANQERIMETLQVTLKSIMDVEARLKQHQNETRASLSFISTLELQNACLALQDDLNQMNAVSLNADDRRQYLSTLERWLKQHLFSPAMTMSASATQSSTLAVELLSSHPAVNIMGFIVMQLQNHLGAKLIPIKYTQLPPLPLFIYVSQLFLQGVIKAELQSDDACASLCNKIDSIIADYTQMAEFLRSSPEVWDSLFKQYEHQRNMVGRALSAANIPNQAVPVHALVTNELKRRQLMDALDQMEERRLLLVRLVEFAFDGGVQTLLHQKVMALETKQQILSTHGSSLHAFRTTKYYYPEANTKDASDMQLALRAGVDLNLGYGNGNVLNYMGCKYIQSWCYKPTKQMVVNLHANLMHHTSPQELLSTNFISTYVPGNTWWSYNFPMRMWLNCVQYNIPLLLIINGFEVPYDAIGWDYFITGNLAINSCHRSSEVKMLMSSTIKQDGLLNRHKLRRAFQYYQTVIQGELSKAEHMIADGVDAYCVLWLVSLLGNWAVFEKLNMSIELAKTVGTFQFTTVGASFHGFWGSRGEDARYYVGGYLSIDMTSPNNRYGGTWPITSRYTPLMVAAEHGRVDVIEGLIAQHEAGKDIGLANTLAWGDSAASLAFQQEYFEIAQRLHDLGAPLSAQQIANLNAKGLPHGAIRIAPAAIIETMEESCLQTQDFSTMVNLKSLASSVQHYANIFKYLLDSKVRNILQAMKQQSVLLNKLNLFDEIVQRAALLRYKDVLSEEVLIELQKQQAALYKTYNGLQDKLKQIAKTCREVYEGEHVVVCSDLNFNSDPLADETYAYEDLEKAYHIRLSALAQDFGINFDNTLALINEAIHHNHQIQESSAQSAVFLFGATGVGKSSLFNFMNGCLYQKVKKSGIKMRELIRGEELSKTHQGGRSETRFPVMMTQETSDKSYAIVDLAGLLDNSENTSSGQISSHDITAAMSMDLLTQKFKQISGLIALCTEAQLTSERPPLELQETFRHIGRMVKHHHDLAENVRLFITKHVELETIDVIERLQLLAKDFSNDEDMSAFLQIFTEESEAKHRIVFTDVIHDADRDEYFEILNSLTPKDTELFNFDNHSVPLNRLKALLEKLLESRQDLINQIQALTVKKESFEGKLMSEQLLDAIPNFEIPIQEDESLDLFIKEQSELVTEFEKIIQLDGLIDRLQQLEQTAAQVSMLATQLKYIQCQENIEHDFIKKLAQLGLYRNLMNEEFLLQTESDKHLTEKTWLKHFGLFHSSKLNHSDEAYLSYGAK